MEVLTAVSEVDLGFPHQFLTSEPLRQALFGNKRLLLDF